jgi:hypothetical protein
VPGDLVGLWSCLFPSLILSACDMSGAGHVASEYLGLRCTWTPVRKLNLEIKTKLKLEDKNYHIQRVRSRDCLNF